MGLNKTDTNQARISRLERLVMGPYLDLIIDIHDYIPTDTPIDIRVTDPRYTVTAPAPGFKHFMETSTEFNMNARLQVYLSGIPQSKGVGKAVQWVNPYTIKFSGPLYSGMVIKVWFTPLSEDIWLQGGLSAYQVALLNGFVGTEEEWLESLVGPPGTANIEVQDEGSSLSTTVNILNVSSPLLQAVLDAPNKVTLVSTTPPPPFQILTFTNNRNVLEIGESIGSNPGDDYPDIDFSWTYNQVPSTSHTIVPLSPPPTMPPLTVSGSYLYAPAVSVATNTTYQLQVVHNSSTYTANTTVYFRPKIYWGVSTNSDASGITDYAGLTTFLDSVSEEFATSRFVTKTFNCTGGRYWYFFFPDSFGTASPEVRIGGFDFYLIYNTTITFQNAAGYTQDYRVYRSDNILYDSAVTVQIL